jgi:hypothetical protein
MKYATAALLLISVGAIAHHSPTMFDNTTAVTVKGTIVRFERVNPHSYLYVDQKTADGRVERWAVEGPGVNLQERRGINADLLTVGATIEACGYVLKDDTKGYASIAIAGRLLVAELVVMPDGQARLWSDYGNRHCRDQYGTNLTFAPATSSSGLVVR